MREVKRKVKWEGKGKVKHFYSIEIQLLTSSPEV
jgi:hypothetical protein